MLRRFSGLGLALFVVSACGEMPMDPAVEMSAGAAIETSDAIEDGYIDNGHVAVGWMASEEYACSATLIGRRTALTAAHCVTYYGEPTFFCTLASNGSEPCMTGIAIPHPYWDGCGWSGCDPDDDIAVIKLDHGFSWEVAPTRISRIPPVEDSRITVVGFGEPETINDPVRRWGYNTIDEVNSKKIQYDGSGGQATAQPGDSGSPSYAGYYNSDCQIGVHSGNQSRFAGYDEVDCRVDMKYWWIKNTANDPTVFGCHEFACNDGICHSQESCSTCPQDCGSCAPPPYCGDGSCNGTETCSTCPSDCGACAGSCCSSPDCECFGDAECSEGYGGECFRGQCMCFE